MTPKLMISATTLSSKQSNQKCQLTLVSLGMAFILFRIQRMLTHNVEPQLILPRTKRKSRSTLSLQAFVVDINFYRLQ